MTTEGAGAHKGVPPDGIADIAGTFKTPFDEAITFFREKLNLPSERWDDIWQAAHDKAFIVAGAQQADLLADLRAAVDRAIAEGKSIEWFRKEFDRIVQKHGWAGWTGDGTKAGRAWRTRVILHTNVATAHAAGRWQQLNDPGLVRLRPYWQYIHADGVMHPRPLHLSWHGLTLPREHYFWQTHFPPNGWFCHCRVKAVAQREYDAAVSNERGPGAAPEEGDTSGIDPGFAYAPGANRMTPLAGLVEKKLFNLEAPIGAAMMQALRPTLLAEQARAFSTFVDQTLADPKPTGRMMAVGAIHLSWVEAASRAGVTPATADITVRDRDIWHTFRDSKQGKLDIEWYKALPYHLLSPKAVVLDRTHPNEPAFLLFYDGGSDGKKLVIRVNYRIKKVGLGNVVETGKIVDLGDVRPMIGNGYDLVEGSL